MIAIGVMTSVNLKHRYTACMNTWGKDFDHVYYFGGVESGSDIIKLENVGEDYRSALEKQFLGLKYMYEQPENHQWFFICGCDTFLYKDNLVEMISQFDPNEELFIGGHCGSFRNLYRFQTDCDLFPSGGGGFFISRKLMDKIYGKIDSFIQEWFSICLTHFSGVHPAAGDVAITYFLWKHFGIKVTVVEGFYGLQPENYSYIVPKPLTFHYISPQQMHQLYEKNRVPL